MDILKSGDKIYRYNKSVIIKFIGKRAVLSTGVLNGGYSENLTAIFNNDAKSGAGMGCILKAPTYKEHMEILSQELGLDPIFTSGLGTAADMENMSIVEEEYGELSVTALVTGGIETNGGRAGDPASYIEENQKIEKVNHGTINIIVSINGKLPPRTLTRALVTITEAKTAAIQELLEGSKYSSGLATGSGTDGVIVYSNLESKNIYNDAGKHSKLGELLGKAVKKAVKEALAKQSLLTPENQKSIFRRGRRYGITLEKIWKRYLEQNSGNFDRKLEWIEEIRELEKDEEVVSLTSLYIHLLDQLEWGLLTKKTVTSHCNIIKGLILEKLGISLGSHENIQELVENYIDIYVIYMQEKWR